MCYMAPDLVLWRMDWPAAADVGAQVEAVTFGPDGGEDGGEHAFGRLAIADTEPGAGAPIPIFEIRRVHGPPVPMNLTGRWRLA